ncbi:MAG: hypothetical protein ACFFD2_23890, partial [Promethearchaeota archaeon]
DFRNPFKSFLDTLILEITSLVIESLTNFFFTNFFIAFQYSFLLLFGTRTLTKVDSSPNFLFFPMNARL